jgi:hypothetical protein
MSQQEFNANLVRNIDVYLPRQQDREYRVQIQLDQDKVIDTDNIKWQVQVREDADAEGDKEKVEQVGGDTKVIDLSNLGTEEGRTETESEIREDFRASGQRRTSEHPNIWSCYCDTCAAKRKRRYKRGLFDSDTESEDSEDEENAVEEQQQTTNRVTTSGNEEDIEETLAKLEGSEDSTGNTPTGTDGLQVTEVEHVPAFAGNVSVIAGNGHQVTGNVAVSGGTRTTGNQVGSETRQPSVAQKAACTAVSRHKYNHGRNRWAPKRRPGYHRQVETVPFRRLSAPERSRPTPYYQSSTSRRSWLNLPRVPAGYYYRKRGGGFYTKKDSNSPYRCPYRPAESSPTSTVTLGNNNTGHIAIYNYLYNNWVPDYPEYHPEDYYTKNLRNNYTFPSTQKPPTGNQGKKRSADTSTTTVQKEDQREFTLRDGFR